MEFINVEIAKKIYKDKLVRGIWICLATTLLLTLIAMLTGEVRSQILLVKFFFTLLCTCFMVGIAGFIIITFTTRKQFNNYRAVYKAYFVEKTLAQIFTHLKYDHARGLPKEILLATRMVRTGDTYSSNDLTMGKYKDVAFVQADVHIQDEHTDSDGNTTYVTVFKGRFMIFEFHKKFNFRLEVAEKGFGANMVPARKQESGRKMHKIELESPEFNKRFKTYSEDGFEAFYLLDPAFMHNIMELADEHEGKLMLGFFENKLLVGLKDGKDAFEPPNVFKKLDEKTEMEKVAREVRPITNFVDKLKLDKKLFVQK